MLSRDLVIFSLVVFLAATVSTAPVEEKEAEEVEIEREEGDEELSEEEEDDDDSKSQDMTMGTGAQQPTTVSKDQGNNAGDTHNNTPLSVHSPQGASPHSGFANPGLSPGAEEIPPETISQVSGHHPPDPPMAYSNGDPGRPRDPASLDAGSFVEAPDSETNGPESPETDSNGNGNKLMVAASLTGHADSADGFSTDPHMDSTAVALNPELSVGSSFQPDLPGPAGPVSSDSGSPDSSPAGGRPVLDSTDAAMLSAMMSHTNHIGNPDGVATNAVSTDSNGNGGFHKPVTDMQHRGDQPVTDSHHPMTSDLQGASRLDSASGVDQIVSTRPGTMEGGLGNGLAHTAITGVGGELATSSHIPPGPTAPGDVYGSSPPDSMGRGEVAVTGGHANVTELLPGSFPNSGSTGLAELQGALTQTESPVTGEPHSALPQLDAPGTVTAYPQGIHEGLSQPGITQQAQPAVSTGEQYITSGQGPEGAENVELEDTC